MDFNICKVAKVLHPDISNVTKKYPPLADLFQRVLIAYQCNDYKEIKELEVLVSRALEDVGEENFEVIIPDIEAKIEELKREIHNITSNEPYIYRELLRNSELIKNKMNGFKEEVDSYSNYKTELESTLKEVQEQ